MKVLDVTVGLVVPIVDVAVVDSDVLGVTGSLSSSGRRTEPVVVLVVDDLEDIVTPLVEALEVLSDVLMPPTVVVGLVPPIPLPVT